MRHVTVGAMAVVLLTFVAGAAPATAAESVPLAPMSAARVQAFVPAWGHGTAPERSVPVQIAGIVPAYDNTVSFGTNYYAGQTGNEAIDDLHGVVASGIISSCSFRYHDDNPAGTATVHFYANPAGRDAEMNPIGGTYTASGLGTGSNLVTIPVLNGPAIDSSLWMGVQFTSRTAGLMLNDTPAVGTSHDFYVENGGFYYFGGNPGANFAVKVVVRSGTVGVADLHAGATELSSPRPNPFRSSASFSFTLDHESPVRIEIFDLRGRAVAMLIDGWREAGTHAIRWSGAGAGDRRVKAGIYFVRMTTPTGSYDRKLLFTP